MTALEPVKQTSWWLNVPQSGFTQIALSKQAEMSKSPEGQKTSGFIVGYGPRVAGGRSK